MSRGLGRMQRAILDAIDRYRTEPLQSWRGGEIVPSGTMYSVSRGVAFNPPLDLIDMRAVKRFVAKQTPSAITFGTFTSAFSASFTRAVRGLEARGILRHEGWQGERLHRFYRKC